MELLPRRRDGHAPIEDYASIGDGRTVALVARDGAIDWLCLPDIDSPSVFGSLLDPTKGGSFTLAPVTPYEVERRYVADTNVLQTTFRTAEGTVRVTDALLIPEVGLSPYRELVRRIEGLSGRVQVTWRVEPRFGYGAWHTVVERRGSVPIARAQTDAVAVLTWQAGTAVADAVSISGRFEIHEGTEALIALSAAHQEPLVFPSRAEIEERLARTIAFWKGWVGGLAYDGPWRGAVVRSALTLKQLVHAASGAIAAAATTSLPEQPGGERNWDYRYCWVRDSSFTLDALLHLGRTEEAHAFFWWLLHASQRTHPRLNALYRLDGSAVPRERLLPLDGYLGSRPVRVGNAAASQVQLDVYGELLQTAWLYRRRGHPIDPDTGRRLGEVADLVCRIWRQPDSGIWEVRSEPLPFTHSKMMCWVALDRAIELARRGDIPCGRAWVWERERDAIRDFIEGCCWSEDIASYTRSAGSHDLDAAILMAPIMGYGNPREPRLRLTLDRLRERLGQGPFLHRYSGEDGLSGGEGAFLTCSFWLVDALARAGRHDEAARTMEELLALANDVGLFAEEADPHSRRFLGNTPQALVHLALICAAVSVSRARDGR